MVYKAVHIKLTIDQHEQHSSICDGHRVTGKTSLKVPNG
jgi:hypothetical protein